LDAAAASAMAVELLEQLLAQERELDSREGILMAQEDGMVASECSLGRVHMECDSECDRAEVVQLDYLARVHTFTAGCRHSLDFGRVLEGCQFFLSM
jgi:hypothetical protein